MFTTLDLERCMQKLCKNTCMNIVHLFMVDVERSCCVEVSVMWAGSDSNNTIFVAFILFIQALIYL